MNTQPCHHPAPDTANLVPSTTTWFSDGSIVVQAENTVFCVYKGILARSSPVFAGLFELPQPLDSPTYEGVPLVSIAESAEEMELFLKALQEWRYGEDGDITDLTLADLAVLARLSLKYMVDALFSKVTAPLRRIYRATTVEEYLDGVKLAEEYQLDGGDHITIVNLARRCWLPELLPTAFYLAAATLGVKQILNGCIRVLESGDTSPMITFDDPADAQTCLVRKQELCITFNPQSLLLLPTTEMTGLSGQSLNVPLPDPETAIGYGTECRMAKDAATRSEKPQLVHASTWCRKMLQCFRACGGG
ncbi:hypothetical protein BDV98DRAFT_572330 [Pterulicium gracile]|uniref:BTB domain-containing protein n=1 Tax=Pterulicium gracile TaxID=1884261 RepID=A0A5C3QFE9_9AGAR|nr:hypothetical protein BDV98DRAFT_572330 [Pterula gracilis]